MTGITDIDAWEVLDSRGNPTVRVQVAAGTDTGTFTVPAGASTGAHEAVERRDGGDRFGGLGVQGAVTTVRENLASLLDGRTVTDQRLIDETLVAHDGTGNLSRLGANAVLGVSGAVAHAASSVQNRPLYAYLADVPASSTAPGTSTGPVGDVPMPAVNLLSGGLHAAGGFEIQDLLGVPIGAESYPSALECIWDVRQALRDILVERGHRPLLADEGGFAPALDSIPDGFELVVEAITRAGYVSGEDVALMVDVAATHFYDDETGTYHLESVGKRLDPDELIDLVCEWTARYPVIAIEDPLEEDAWDQWATLSKTVNSGVLVIGDDLLVTDRKRLERMIDREAGNAVLVKPNQAGTLTDAIDVIRTAQHNDIAPIVSARSGETCDTTIADLAVGLNASRIKIGSLARSERLAKYNRLQAIDRKFDIGFSGTFLPGGPT